MSLSKEDMIGLAYGLIYFVVIAICWSPLLYGTYLLSVALASWLHLNNWLFFFGIPGLIIGLFISRERKRYRRQHELARQLKEQHQIDIQTVSTSRSRVRSKESFKDFLQILKPYEYVTIFQLFKDQVEAFGLTEKCKRIEKEVWTATKADIEERLPDLWESIHRHNGLEFLIYDQGAWSIDAEAMYRDYNPNKLGLGTGREAVARAFWLSENPDKDVVSLVFGEDMEATFVFRKETRIGVAEIMESVVQHLIPEEDL